jgi:hypothetical protein
VTTREEARRLVNEAWERSVVRLVAHYGGLAARDIAEEQRDELADAMVAAVAERDKAWREWLTRRFRDEWISTCGDLPDRQPEPNPR